MKVLVIDTALGACTVGVFEDERPLAVRSEPMVKGHSERIGGFVRDTVASAGDALGGFEALDRIGVTVGPGSFTGLRVGLAFAQGLGAALGIPVVGISTLAALAETHGRDDETVVASLIDARRGQIYLQTFLRGSPLTEPEAIGVTDLADRQAQANPGKPWRLAGSGAPLFVEAMLDRLPELDPAPDVPPPADGDLIVDPTAEALAALTLAADPADHPPRPLYLRAPDATPPTRLPGQARPPRAQP